MEQMLVSDYVYRKGVKAALRGEIGFSIRQSHLYFYAVKVIRYKSFIF